MPSSQTGTCLSLTKASEIPKVAAWLQALKEQEEEEKQQQQQEQHEEDEVVVAVVQQQESAEQPPIVNYEELIVRGLDVDLGITSVLIELTKRNIYPIWECMEILNCEGRLDNAIRYVISNNSVKVLRLVNVEMDQNGFVALGQALHTNTSLTELRLTTPMLEGPNISAALVQGLSNNTTLTHIDFKGTSFDTEGVIELGKGIRHNRSLTHMFFYGCGLDDDDMSIVIRALQYHPTIQVLDLNGNRCGPKTTAALSDMLQTVGCSLQRLDLGCQRTSSSSNDTTTSSIVEGIDVVRLAQALIENKSLQVLELTSNQVNDIQVGQLAKALTTNQTLCEVYLARNKITNVGIEYIAEYLPHMLGLKKLSLWGNQLNDNCVNQLYIALQSNVVLEQLNLFQRFKASISIQQLLRFNRGGRRIYYDCTANDIPIGLWPHLLERINRITMVKGSPVKDKAAKLDALYHFVQGPAVMSSSSS